MFSSKVFRITLLFVFITAGIWLLSRSSSLTPESVVRSEAQLALAPARNGSGNTSDDLTNDDPRIVQREVVSPVTVNLQDIPSHPSDVDDMLEQFKNGERDIEVNEGPLSESAYWALVAESAQQGVDKSVQNYQPEAVESTLTLGNNWKSIDYTQSQQGVPPDPDITVGTNQVVVGVNTSFQVFNKSGTSLVGPTLFESFWGNNCGTGSSTMSFFDPFLDYDEQANRYILGITAYDTAVNGGDNGYACIAVSQTDNAAGSWHLYSFDGNPGGGTDYFFDYPHLGVGQNALYLSANMFGASFVRNHVFAYDKNAMYAGLAANSVKINVGSSNFTIQPAKMHGFANGGWPTNPNEPHYLVDAQYGNNQNTLTVWRFSDPFGSASLTQAGTVGVNSYSLPVTQSQSGTGGTITGNDNRLLDVKYWGGRLYATHHIGCNPGGGTVNCIRWYIIDISSGSPTLVDQGTLSSSGNYRSFPAIAPNACGDLAVGYTRMNTSSFPSVYIAGREAGDPAGQLKNETLVHAGEATYTAYDTAPRRWGDYTGMGIDPDGVTFWYVGEYSRNQATARWSTWISAATFPGCSVGPTPTPGPTATATNTPLPTNTPGPTSCTVYNSTDVPKSISTSGTPSISSVLNVPTSGTIVDVNVLNLNGTHTYINDLDFNLTSPLGTEVQIMARSCSSQDNFNLSLDDEAAPGSWPCPPVGGGTYQPSNALSAYDGQNRAGTWTLRIDDNANLDGGSLNGWGLEICVAGGGPTATNTPAPPTATNTAVPPTATNTPAPPTATNTAVPPTATNTAVPPTPTSTATPPTGGTIFFDNFETNLGWTVNPSGSDSATTGQWQRANPEQTTSGSTTLQLGTTVSGNNDLVTGSLAGSSAGANDIDGGTTSIRSPNIVLPSSGNITLSFSYYLAHLNNATNVDFLRVSVVGSSTSLVLEELGSADNDSAVWDSFSTNLNSFAGQTVYLLIQAADAGGGSLVEAGIDDVRIEVGTTSSCVTYTSSNVPISLPNGTSSISSNLTVSGATSIGDLNLSVDMAHAWVGDLSMVLTHQSTGTSVTVLDRPGVPASTYGCSGDNILATLDDEAAVPVENQCGGSVPTINGTFSPNNALSAFDGQSGNGTWVLQVIDNYTASDAGTLNGWSIEVCSP